MSLTYVKSNIGGYFFDVTFKETHSFENVITQNPVQSGANVNDHVYQQPITLTLEIGVSDCLASVLSGQFASASTRSISAFNVLRALWQTAQLLTVNTLFASYPNMIIKTLSVPKDKSTMYALRATVVMQEVIVTNAVSISISQKTSTDPQATSVTNGGVKTPSPSTLFQTLKISKNDFISGKVKYGATAMTLDAYFKKYSGGQASLNFATSKYVVTPIISAAVSNISTFTINGKTLTYAQFISAYVMETSTSTTFGSGSGGAR